MIGLSRLGQMTKVTHVNKLVTFMIVSGHSQRALLRQINKEKDLQASSHLCVQTHIIMRLTNPPVQTNLFGLTRLVGCNLFLSPGDQEKRRHLTRAGARNRPVHRPSIN